MDEISASRGKDDELKLERKKRFLKIVIFVIIGLVVLSFLSKRVTFIGGFPMFKMLRKEVEKTPVSAIPVPVKGFKVSVIDFQDNLPALGTIKGFREVDLKFSVAGYIEYINFREGERVVEGDIIASLDQREALLKLEYAKNEMEKSKKLHELGSVIEMKVRQSELEYQSARMEYEKTNLIAPDDGYIGTIALNKGDYATPNDRFGTFVNLSHAYAEFGVIEKEVAKIRMGQEVEVTVDAYPEDVFQGEIESISPNIEGKTRTFKVKARLINPDEKLRAGMFGRIAVEIYEKDNTIVIPSSSFKKKEQEYFVYVIHPEGPSAEAKGAPQAGVEGDLAVAGMGDQEVLFGSVEIRPIQIAYTTPDAIEIRAGLEEGEIIVMDIQQDLEDKARVEVTEVQEHIF